METTPLCPARLENLMVCTDGSPDSQGAMAGAISLAGSCGSKIYILRVIEFNPEFEAQAPEAVARWEAKMYADLAACRREAEAADIPVEVRVRRAEAAYAGIIEEAEKVNPELIIMGRRGGSRLFRLMMGNVVARVIGLSRFNVLVVPKGVTLKFSRLLVASDGSPHSYAAWDEGLYITQRVGSELLALSVARDDSEIETAQAIVQRLETEAKLRGISLTPLVRRGRPYEAIVQAAKETGADVIVMGALGMTGLTSLLMGSVTERVIAHAPCAVLVVKRVM